MPEFDPSRSQLKPGDRLRFSDGAEEAVVSHRDGRRLPALPGARHLDLWAAGEGLRGARGDRVSRSLARLCRLKIFM